MSSTPAVENTDKPKRNRPNKGKKEGATEGAAKPTDSEAQKRPKTAGRGKNAQRTNESAAANQDGGKGRGRRPQTARQAAAEAELEETKVGGGQGPNKDSKDNKKGPNQRAGQQSKAQDKNSWIYKYHNMERPEYQKIAFTTETEIPELPAKKDILKEPAKADFDREMAAQDNLIQQKRTKKDQLIKHKRQMREGGLTNGGDKTKRGELTERINVVKGIRANKQAKQASMRDIVAQMDTLENEKRALLKNMHPGCHSVEEVNDAINNSERRLTTTSMSAAQEGKLIKEIEVLKASIPKAKRFSEINPKIQELKAQKNKIWAEVKVIRSEEDALNHEMEGIRKELELTNAEKDEIRVKVDAVQTQIEGVDTELNALYAKKDEMRENYWKGRYDFKQQRETIQHIEWMQRQKDKVVNAKQYKLEREEERQAAIKTMPHPYMKELDTCEHLENYLNSLKMRAGLLVDSEEVARQAQAQMASEAVAERMQEKVAAGKVEVSMSKKDREAQNTLQIGGGGKKKGKKPKKAVVEYEDSFNLDIAIIKKFNTLGVTAPVVPADLDDRLSQINERRQWYQENGAAKLQEQIEELKRFGNEEEKDFEEDEGAAEEGSKRGGRGGYRGGRGGSSRGRGRGGFGGFQPKSEFDGEDDEDYVYSAPANKPKRNKQRQEDLKMDDNNYPTL